MSNANLTFLKKIGDIMNFYAKNMQFLTKTKINQNRLAEIMGITRQSINKMINATDPKAETLIKISEIYNVSIDDLLKKDLSKV